MAGALVAFGVVAIVVGGNDSHACHEEGDETDLCDIGIFFGGLVFVLAVVVAAVIVTMTAFVTSRRRNAEGRSTTNTRSGAPPD